MWSHSCGALFLRRIVTTGDVEHKKKCELCHSEISAPDIPIQPHSPHDVSRRDNFLTLQLKLNPVKNISVFVQKEEQN